LVPADCYWTSIDATTTPPTTGKMRRLRGVHPGAPDLWVVYRGKLIGIELKSKDGRRGPAQLATRQRMMRAGAAWWECRSPNAMMWVLHHEGVPFNMIACSDGTIECWQPLPLAPWEVPRSDPARRRSQRSGGRRCVLGGRATSAPARPRSWRVNADLDGRPFGLCELLHNVLILAA
jgi:hypothetical protein